MPCLYRHCLIIVFMKKFLLAILLLAPILVYAEPVDEVTAGRLAGNFMKSLTGSDAGLRLVMSGGSRVTKSGGAPDYYIYNKDRGFVIIAGDDCVSPVIGYSDRFTMPEGRIPDNMQAWLDQWSALIADKSPKGIVEPGAREKWEELRSGNIRPATRAGEDELELETALWNQGDPYNLQCPKDGADLSITGCTATATCIIMKYHGWPDAGVGASVSYTTYSKGINVPVRTLGGKYEWSKMPLSYTGSESDEQKNAVAKLMADVGALLKSDYSAESTGAYTQDVVKILGTNFKYDKSCVERYGVNYTKDTWIQMLKDNIKNVGPVLYSGVGSGGHAFVADGYDKDNLIHINWGWGGSGNGYFDYPNFNEFTSSHAAVLNITKDKGGDVVDNLSLYHWPERGTDGFSITVDRPEAGTSFDARLFYLANFSPYSFTGHVGVGKWDRSGNLVEVCGYVDVSIDGSSNGGIYLNDIRIPSCKFNTAVSIGDYLTPVYRSSYTPQWTVVPYDMTAAGFTGKIYIADAMTLAEATSVTYNYAGGVATVTTKAGAEMSLVDGNGNRCESSYKVEDATMTIDVKSLPAGRYVLVLDRGEEHKEVELIFGN